MIVITSALQLSPHEIKTLISCLDDRIRSWKKKVDDVRIPEGYADIVISDTEKLRDKLKAYDKPLYVTQKTNPPL